jgi:DNA modification methylase
MAKTQERPLTIEQVPIGDLRPDPFNPRRISDAELDALTRSIQQFGLVDPIVARREDRTVIGGHQRLVAARRLGLETVPVVYVDLSPEQAKLLNLALNKISGEWDEELLARMLADLQETPDVDISLSGFGEDEIGKLLKTLEIRDKRDRPEQFDVEAAVKAAQAAPVAKRGELWMLGEHRLLCGDSTDSGDVGRLMGEERAALIATDPPYLVDYDGGSHPASKANKGRKNKDKHWDTYQDPETSVGFFKRFLRLGLDYLRENGAIYQWHAFWRQKLVQQAWEECGLLVHQQIIWVKSRGVLTYSHYRWQHEPCFYGWREGSPPPSKLRPPAGETTVWRVGQEGESMDVHPTQKPVELFTRPISYHTEPGDVCYEPFLGSGTCLIAAERLSRRCFAMELEPAYVDVAIARWEAFTGERAVRENAG